MISVRINIKLAGSSMFDQNDEIRIFYITNSLVKSLKFSKKSREIKWNGCDDHGRKLPAGIYFCELTARGFTKVKKVVLLK
jgi:hypothetical protein